MFKKRFFQVGHTLLSAILVITLLPASALAVEGDVEAGASIGEALAVPEEAIADDGGAPSDPDDSPNQPRELPASDEADRATDEELSAALSEAVAQCVAAGNASEYDRALWFHDWVIDTYVFDDGSLCNDAAAMFASGTGNADAFFDLYLKVLKTAGIEAYLYQEDGLLWAEVVADGAVIEVDIARNAYDVAQEGNALEVKHRYFAVAEAEEGEGAADTENVAEPEPSLELQATEEGADGEDEEAPAGPQVKATLSADEKTVTITAQGGDFAQATNVRFPTWSLAGGQDDLVWYSAAKTGDGWTQTVWISSHRSIGVYAVHVYGVVGGRDRFLGSTSFEVKGPAAEVSISQTDDQIDRCVFQVDITMTSCPSGVVSMQAPTWSIASGQDDLVWYTVPRPAAGDGTAPETWSLEVPCVAPNRAPGAYLSHIYVTAGNGTSAMAGWAQATVEAAAAQLSVEVAPNEMTVTVKGTGAAFAQASRVQLPTWSLAGGQDDIVWYDAVRNGRNEWVATVSIPRHRTAGSYAVHGYGTVGGQLRFLGVASFDITPTQATVSLSQSEDQIARGVFQVTVDVETCPSGVSLMQAPTWSAADGQDDLVWYTVPRPASVDGTAPETWTIEVPCAAPNRAPGAYVTHIYITTNNGILAFASSSSGTFETAPAALSAEVASNEMTVTVKGIGEAFARASRVQFPTWSLAGGQDDLVWYEAVRNGRNEWVATVSIPRHRTAGTYAVHAYITTDGRVSMAATTSFTIASTGATASFSQSDDQIARGVFQVTVDVETCPSGVSLMQAPTWSVAGGQDDLVWYTVPRPSVATASLDASDGSEPALFTAVALETGSWTIEIPCAAPNREPGAYLTHVYITTNNGIMAYAAATTGTAELGPAHIEAYTTDGELTFTIEAYGGDYARASALALPTWSTNKGQDDLVWYNATRKGAGWILSVPIRNHRTAGDYLVHAYPTIRGQQRMMGSTGFKVQAPTASVALMDTGNGFYTVETSAIQSPSGVASVQVPSWTKANGQDDIVWHNAANAGEGLWRCRVEAGAHGGQEGEYLTHVYATASNGVQAYVGAVTAQVTCVDYVFVTGASGTGRRTLWIKNPTVSGAVQMPTWSSVGGQDDIVWYNASHRGGNLWGADVDCGNLRHAGTVITHVYAGGKMVGSITFTVTENDLATYRGTQHLANIINGATGGFGTFGIGYDMNSPNGRWLQDAIHGVESGGRSLGFLMVDLKTGRGVAYAANRAFYSASSIKGPYVAAINKFYPWTVNGWIPGTMAQTVEWSSNEGYASLRNRYGASPMTEMRNFSGGGSFYTQYNYVDINAKDLAKLWVGCYDYFFVNQNERSGWCRSLYTDPYLSFIRRAHAGRYDTYSKAGWISYGGRLTVRNDAGIVMAGDRPYVVAILSSAYGKDNSLVNLVNALDAVHSDLVR